MRASRAASISSLRPVFITSAIWSASGMPIRTAAGRTGCARQLGRRAAELLGADPVDGHDRAFVVIMAISWSALSSTALRVAVRSATLDSRAVL
jgi:hypothetical protein